jgi:2-hydroxychromene-2-carboxylate isomerase
LYTENLQSQETTGASTWVDASNPTTYFNSYAKQLGLNLKQFESDYNSNKVNSLITADMAEGNKLGVQGTPTFYLDGKQISVGESASAFESVIKAEIAKKTGQASSTTTTPTNTGTTSQTKK